jgi:hypothetical protein
MKIRKYRPSIGRRLSKLVERSLSGELRLKPSRALDALRLAMIEDESRAIHTGRRLPS